MMHARENNKYAVAVLRDLGFFTCHRGQPEPREKDNLRDPCHEDKIYVFTFSKLFVKFQPGQFALFVDFFQ